MDVASARDLLDHPDAPVRSWTLRLLDPATITGPLRERLIGLARTEPNPEVRSELAGTAARVGTNTALPVLHELLSREEDVPDRYIPLRIWWALESRMTSDPELVLDWLSKGSVWQAPLFAAHLESRIARRLAAERGDTQSFTRIDPERNWKAFALHPRSRMPGGKGDYTDWETNYTPEVSERSLTRLARLLEMAPSRADRERLLAGVRAGLDQGAAPDRVPPRLLAVIGAWWAEGPQTEDLMHVAARLGHPDALAKAGTRAGAGARPSAAGEPAETPAPDARGAEAFLTFCAPCHQTDGSGMARLAAPLRNSTWVLGHDELLARIVLHGVKGELLMPPMGTLDDQQLALILTYIRRAWGHGAAPVSPETIARVRAATPGRTAPWTRDELSALRIPD
jgi:mono/diheme cytochrome c family protein